MRRRRIAGVDALVANLNGGVHDLVTPVGRNGVGHGAGAEGKLTDRFSAQHIRIECEGLFALPVEEEVGNDFHLECSFTAVKRGFWLSSVLNGQPDFDAARAGAGIESFRVDLKTERVAIDAMREGDACGWQPLAEDGSEGVAHLR